jgi:hypothetical protein
MEKNNMEQAVCSEKTHYVPFLNATIKMRGKKLLTKGNFFARTRYTIIALITKLFCDITFTQDCSMLNKKCQDGMGSAFSHSFTAIPQSIIE